MKSYLDGLNEKQKEAVLHTSGPVLIVAGAGAGKTKTITHRIFHLIKTGATPGSILAITFTNKAAKEMRDRVTSLIKDAPESVSGIKNNNKSDTTKNTALKNDSFGELPFVSTFHALGVYIIKQNAALLGLPRFFSIYDKNDGKRIVKDALISLNYDPKQIDPGRIQNTISREKGNFVTASEYSEKIGNEYFPKIVSAVWTIYEQVLRREQALDLDDLILVTAKLLASNESVRKYYQGLWKYIHIDEYQDTNSVQYHIARLLAAEHRNICVVGDTDQNIYSWRGADIKNMLRFEKDYPEAKVVLLEENYRSTQTILAAANKIIKKNNFRIEKNLFTKNENGEKIGLYNGLSEIHEAIFIAGKVAELLESGVATEEIAVLYRANFQSRILEDAFMARGLPYTMVGTKFFERKEIKDMLSFLRAALNPKSTADIKRIINVPPRGIGPVTIEKIIREEIENGKKEHKKGGGGEKEAVKKTLSAGVQKKVDVFFLFLFKIREKVLSERPSAVIKFIMKESGVEDLLKRGTDEDQERLENIMELVTLAAKYDTYPGEEGIERLLADAALVGGEEVSDLGITKEKNKNGVRLMTVHASKGLEFDYVFIAGLEQDLFPHRRMGNYDISDEDAEEERRLFYVALTRARKKIYLSYAESRTIFGERNVGVPSEFVFDIDEKDTEREMGNETFEDFENKPKKSRFIEF